MDTQERSGAELSLRDAAGLMSTALMSMTDSLSRAVARLGTGGSVDEVLAAVLAVSRLAEAQIELNECLDGGRTEEVPAEALVLAGELSESLRSRLSTAELASAVLWHDQGMANTAIAELLGVSQSTVSRVLAQARRLRSEHGDLAVGLSPDDPATAAGGSQEERQ